MERAASCSTPTGIPSVVGRPRPFHPISILPFVRSLMVDCHFYQRLCRFLPVLPHFMRISSPPALFSLQSPHPKVSPPFILPFPWFLVPFSISPRSPCYVHAFAMSVSGWKWLEICSSSNSDMGIFVLRAPLCFPPQARNLNTHDLSEAVIDAASEAASHDGSSSIRVSGEL